LDNYSICTLLIIRGRNKDEIIAILLLEAFDLKLHEDVVIEFLKIFREGLVSLKGDRELLERLNYLIDYLSTNYINS